MLPLLPHETVSPWKVTIMTNFGWAIFWTALMGAVVIAASIFAGIQSSNKLNACLEKGGYMVVTKSESVCAKLEIL